MSGYTSSGAQQPEAGPSKRASESYGAARNAPPSFSTGLKIAGVCTAVVTVGLAIPLVIARQRSAATSATANNAAASLHRRPAGASPSALLRQQHNASTRPIASTPTPAPSMGSFPSASILRQSRTKTPKPPASGDAIFHAIKALGVATGIVTVSASAVVLTFRYATGIHSVAEFTPYMHQKLIRILPTSLTSRLDPPDDPNDIIFPSHSSSSRMGLEEAERRMQQAYAEGGVVKFGQQMWTEFEREWNETSQANEKASSRDDPSPGDRGSGETTSNPGAAAPAA
ncbi:hypothetical protein DL93DRAFT_2077459 [Clavulina sp. PMI_390]|nr:hypothetical protein DL93DRAFT_2077459 [Clavulina sp. PMI_390]